MPFQPGTSGNPSGKPKGTLSKTTIAFKQALIECFEKIGGVNNLVKWAKKNPTEFYRIMSKMIPLEVTGAGGSPLPPVTFVEIHVVNSESEPAAIPEPHRNGSAH